MYRISKSNTRSKHMHIRRLRFFEKNILRKGAGKFYHRIYKG